MRIIFKDGPTFDGTDATEVLTRLAAVQPEDVKDAAQMKRILAVRAQAWSRVELDPTVSDEQFVLDAALAGLFKVDVAA